MAAAEDRNVGPRLFPYGLPVTRRRRSSSSDITTEMLVRGVLVAALEVIPAADDARKAKLRELAAVTEAERIDFLIEQAKSIENDDRRKNVIDALKA